MRLAPVVLAAALLAACGPPSDPQGWARQAVRRNRLDEKIDALEQVRKAPGDRKAAVPPLLEVLKQAPRARGEAALILGEIGDASAVKPLIEAVELGGADRDTFEANRRIADALGALRAREAVPVLVKLTGSRDAFTQVAAVDALGAIGDPGASDTLMAIAVEERAEPFLRKKALLALGRIGDARAATAVMRMLFAERPGVTFFPEASFAAVQIGKPMAEPLLAVLEGRDATLARWASEHGVVPGALVAKSAQLLGDVGDAAAVPALVSKLGYKDAVPDMELFVHAYAAESLGRMRARAAVKPLVDTLVREKDPDVRDRYCDAIARIGDASAIPGLVKAAVGPWQQSSGPLLALSRLGGEKERAVIATRRKECGQGCPAPQQKAYAGMLARLDAAKACDADAACWATRLADQSAAVRDRAALEVARAGGARVAAALGEAIVRPVVDDEDLQARYHAVLALGWVAASAPLGPPGADLADRIDRMIGAEKGRSLTAGVNEDAFRLAERLRRISR
jgi:HEAT repeat protein